MDYVTYDHRHALTLFENEEEYISLFDEILETISNITDEDLINKYNDISRRNIKSLSQPINNLLKERLVDIGWHAESAIFNDPRYTEKRWRLDFAKDEISVEVAFNHGEAISWNLIKPVLASELNHVEKEIQTSAGIVICATEEMKRAGNFDDAVGTYEKFIRYLIPMQNMLPTPILLIGLKAPETFKIDHDSKQVIML